MQALRDLMSEPQACMAHCRRHSVVSSSSRKTPLPPREYLSYWVLVSPSTHWVLWKRIPALGEDVVMAIHCIGLSLRSQGCRAERVGEGVGGAHR